jgi:putative transposase
MARLPRLAVPGQAHHIVQRGNNGQPIFIEDQDRSTYLSMLSEAAVQHGVRLHAYALMNDRLDLLATPTDGGGLSLTMQAIGRRYVAWFNRRHQRSGTLWEGRFRGCVLESEHFLIKCMCYIEQGPVRAGLAADPGDYVWSSFAHHVGRSSDPLLTDHALFWTLGNTPFDRQVAYEALARQMLPRVEAERLEAAALKGWPLGSPEFLRHIMEQTGRRTTPKPRGRPRKAARLRAPN